MRIGVCCCTYLRPELLSYVLWCFEQQTHEDRVMLVADDADQLEERDGDRWEIVRLSNRKPTLGAKRNTVARILLKHAGADAVVSWDDDDLFLPHALEATAAALANAEWSRPSQSCLLAADNRLWRLETFSRAIGRDKACQCGWGIRREAFEAVGGYDERLSVGEDLDLAQRLEARGTTECDPVTLGYEPWYVWGPWRNRHLSELTEDYAAWQASSGQRVRVVPKPPPGVDLDNPVYLPGVSPRPWQQNWYGERKA